MSSLIGIPIPVHSVGTLPLPFLSVDNLSKAKLMLTNARQISEQFRVKFGLVKKHSFYFVPFEKLSLSKIVQMERRIAELITNNRSLEAIALSKDLINLSLEGVQYYHTYHRTALYVVVICGFIGGMALSAVMVLSKIALIKDQARKISPVGTKSNRNITAGFMFLSLVIVISLFLLNVPYSYYLYFLLPLPIWHHIATKNKIVKTSLKLLVKNPATLKSFLFYLFVGLVGIWALVASFFYRWVLTFELLLFAVAVLATDVAQRTKVSWFLVCCLSSIFPLLPVVGREANNLLVVAGGLLGSLCSCLLADSLRIIYILPLFSSCLAVATYHLSTQYGVIPPMLHFFSWSILASSWILPIFASTRLRSRMLTVYTCHCAVYMLISLSYDSIFCVLFCVLLLVWIKLEAELSGNRNLNFDKLDFKHSTISLGKLVHVRSILPLFEAFLYYYLKVEIYSKRAVCFSP